MSEEQSRIFRELEASEVQPLFPWKDSGGIMEQMKSICVDDQAARLLIRRFAPSFSIVHSGALCGVLVEYAGAPGCGERVNLLLEFFEQLRLRNHLPVTGTLLSKVSYIIQRDRRKDYDQAAVIALATAVLDMCEQAQPSDWEGGRIEDQIDRVSAMLSAALTPTTRRSEAAKVLMKQIERAEQKIRFLQRPTSRK